MKRVKFIVVIAMVLFLNMVFVSGVEIFKPKGSDILHKNLDQLQGGSSEEYYHLNLSTFNNVMSQIFNITQIIMGENIWENNSDEVSIKSDFPQDLKISGNATFEKDVIISGTLFGGSPVKIAGIDVSNNSFSQEDNLNSSLRFTLKNINSGTNSTSVISTINDVEGKMSIGIGSSKFMIGLKNYMNVTALFSKSRGEMVFANFFNQKFSWLYNPQDDEDANNLVELMSLDSTGLNITQNLSVDGVLHLSEYTLSPANSVILRRNQESGAVFGISNNVAGSNNVSGVGYVWTTNTSNYTIDLHSSLDQRNPDQIIHHLRGNAKAEKWRGSNVVFEFESSLNNFAFQVNTTSNLTTFNDIMKLNPRAVAPTNPSLGLIYVDSDTSEFCFYNSTEWVGLVNGGTCS